MQTKEFSPAAYAAHLAALTPSRRLIVEMHGTAYVDRDGTRWVPPGTLGPVTRSLGEEILVTRASTASKPTTTIAPVTTSPVVQRPRVDVSDLLEEIKSTGRSDYVGDFDVEAYLAKSEAKRPPKVEPPREKRANDVSDLLDEWRRA